MTEQLLPPLPAKGNVLIEIYGPEPGAARWDEAQWDVATWAMLTWQNVTPQSMVMKLSWGADDPAGVLTSPAAGSWSIETYDPQRVLDPANGASPYSASLRPGRPMRISVAEPGQPGKVLRVGLIDEITYDIREKRGSIRGTDIVPLIVQATMQKGQNDDPAMPDTLRARARYILTKVLLDRLVPVESDPVGSVDPPVGPLPNDQEASAWSHIGTSAFDALYAMWIDRTGTLRFRSFGDPVDNGFTVGGVDGIPISTVKTNASIANVYTAVRAYDQDAPTVAIYAVNEAAADLYGITTLTRDKPVPDGQTWVDSVLADRAGSGLQYQTGTLYPRTFAELNAIIELEMVDILHIVADDIVPPLDISARILGAKLTADTDTGWTAEVISYIPANEWSEAETPPEPEPEPPPDTQSGVVRYYDANKDSRAARDSSGTNLGSGTEELPVGAWQGWRNRAFIDFADISWAGVVSVDRCELELDTSSQVNIGFGSSPKVTVKRVTASWSEGSSSSPSGSNATKYPGPAVTSTDAKTAAVPSGENAAWTVDITGIGKAWKAGSPQYGVGIFSAGEDATKYTTEFWSRENSTAGKRPRLKLTLTIEV